MKFNPITATFTDEELEKEYLEHETGYLVKYIRPAVLILGLLFFLFIIPDYYLNSNPDTFRMIFFLRSTFLLLVLIFFILLGKRHDRMNLLNWVSAYAMLVTIFYLIIYYIYDFTQAAPNFFVQALAIITLIIVFFNVIRYWIHALVISLLLGCGFIAISLHRPEDIPVSGLSAVIVYILIIIILSSISAYRIQLHKRSQFVDRRNLELMSEIDHLTDIYNKGKFDLELTRWIELTERYGDDLSLIMFDLDDLKRINDQYGHLVGDAVLMELASLVNSRLRASDIFARWGGDEFIILLPHTAVEQAVNMAERLRELMASHRFNQVGKLSCSFGVAEHETGGSSNTLLKKVDEMLYQAKRQGKNLVVSS